MPSISSLYLREYIRETLTLCSVAGACELLEDGQPGVLQAGTQGGAGRQEPLQAPGEVGHAAGTSRKHHLQTMCAKGMHTLCFSFGWYYLSDIRIYSEGNWPCRPDGHVSNDGILCCLQYDWVNKIEFLHSRLDGIGSRVKKFATVHLTIRKTVIVRVYPMVEWTRSSFPGEEMSYCSHDHEDSIDCHSKSDRLANSWPKGSAQVLSSASVFMVLPSGLQCLKALLQTRWSAE